MVCGGRRVPDAARASLVSGRWVAKAFSSPQERAVPDGPMPEGDTVLRTARRLNQALAGRPLVRAELRWPTLGDADLAGRTVTAVTAYGKHILTRIAATDHADSAARGRRRPTVPDEPLTLRSHLRMEGRWYVHARNAEPWPSAGRASVRAVLGGTEWTAVGTWLGLLDLVPTAAERELIGHLGPDIMADGFDVDRAVPRLLTDPSRAVGAVLLDQTTVAGIGTMYMAEALFVQRISPWTPVAQVDLPALLSTARRQLLRGASQAVPSTTGNPRRGLQTYVHGRSGRPCQRCGTPVRVAEIGPSDKRRPAFYCPACQPGPTPTDDGRPQRPLGANPAYREYRRPTGYR